MPGFLPNVVTEASLRVMLELAFAASLLTLLCMSVRSKAPRAVLLGRRVRLPRRSNQDLQQGG